MESIVGHLNDMWIQVGKRLLCVPAKNGSMSFRVSIMPELKGRPQLGNKFIEKARERKIGLYSTEYALSLGLPMFLSVRHPVDRFSSLWRDLQRKSVRTLLPLRFCSPDQLMDAIEKYPDGNDHWVRQTYYWREGVHVVPYNQFLSRMHLPYKWEHRSEDLKAEMPTDRILKHFAGDVELWHAARNP